MNVVIGVSNRHVHVTKNVWNKLFGDKEMEVRNFLNQPGQFASTSTVDIKIDNLCLDHLRVVGPFREYNQVEISASDAKILGVNPPRRQSGDLKGSLPVKLCGPNGEVSLELGLILADAHIHMDNEMARELKLNNNDEVWIINDGSKLFKAKIKISDNAYFELHIDKDEEALYNLHTGDYVEFAIIY